MTLKFYNNTSDNNVVDKEISQLFSIDGTLRQPCSILNPVITIARDTLDVVKCNYMYSQDFKRYYYITDIVSINNKLWEIHCRVDVLMTYKDEFLPLNALINRQATEANLYLADGTVPLLPQKIIETVPISGMNFSTNSIGTNTTIVLATVGKLKGD